MRRLPVRQLLIIALGACLAALAGPATVAAAEPAATARYVVTTKSAGAADSKVSRLRSARAPIGRRYSHVFHGFSASLTAAQVRQLTSDPSVETVRPVTAVHASAVGEETGGPWGLDRIDQRSGLDNRYFYNSTGASVTAYLIDTGIRMDQADLQGRASSGYDFVDNDTNASDCPSNYHDDPSDGLISHGTHVAGTIGGRTWGVAKKVSIVSLRVLDCQGQGTSDGVIAALDWVIAHHTTPAVVNLSLGGPRDADVNAAVETTIGAGVSVVVAAGNESDNACGTSPASAPDALTVGASDRRDNQAGFSNWGPCVDLWAPGVGIRSAGTKTTTSSLVLDGTSMATPHVTGAVARYLQTHPTAAPAQVGAAIVGSASKVGIGDSDGSPDRLLYVYSQKVPSAPTGVTTSRSDKSKTATIRWSVPKSDGGEPITGYQAIRVGKDATGHTSSVVNLGSTARSYTFKGLVAGTTYTLTVKARNAVGLGNKTSAKVTITALPGKPKITSAKSGSTTDTKSSIVVRWSQPGSGGSVKNYLVSATPAGNDRVVTLTMSARARGLTISGLKRNAAYTIRVRARNDSGTGAADRWRYSVRAR